MEIAKIEQVFKKNHIHIFIKKKEIFLWISSFKSPIFPEELGEVIAYLTCCYNGLNSFRTYHIPYCLLPRNTLYRNIYYEKNKRFHYVKVSQCKLCKYNKFCPGIIDKCKSEIKPRIKPIPDVPIEVVIEINKNCNLNCKLCLVDKKEMIELSIDKIKGVIDEAKALGIEAIRITGGEPLLRKDIFEILTYIKSKGFYVLFNTNGILLNHKVIKKLEVYVDNILVSLQGYNENSENILTGGGIFLKKKLMNLIALASSKIDMVRVDTIISRILIENLNKYFLLIKALGLKNWVLNRPLFPKGSRMYLIEYDISKKDMIKVMDYICRLRRYGITANIGNAVPFCITKDSTKRLLLWANDLSEGHSRIIYSATGLYRPAYTTNINLGRTLREALANPFLKEMKSLCYLPKRCWNCLYLKDCLGGSRYLAREFNGSYFASDPWIKNG